MIKILLVDDEDLILYSLAKTLKHAGAAVTSVTNAKDALVKVRDRSYDVCFLDVQLPDANGLDLVNVIRELSPDTAIIIMTGIELTNEQLRSLRNRGCEYLPKPFDIKDAFSFITELTRKKSGVP